MQSKLLQKKYAGVQVVEVGQLKTVSASELSTSGCFLNDNEGNAGYLKTAVFAPKFLSTVIFLDVPDEVLIQRWHATMQELDSSHNPEEDTR